jgi:mannonate dehydratase
MIEIAEILLESGPHPFWRQLKQIDVNAAVSGLPRHFDDWRAAASEHPWDYGPLALHKQHLEDAGFRLAVIEDNPPMDAMRLGRPGREEELEHFCTLLRTMGRLEIPVLCYNWMPVLSWLRTSIAAPGRGGAEVTGYDHRVLADAPLTPAGVVHGDDLWASFQWFLERVVPVAEEAGVKLALHPDDPPRSPIRGIDRVMISVDAFQRAIDLVPSELNGITMCQGNFTLMTDDLPAAITQFGEQGKIHFIHFRDVVGTADRFLETFHDEGKTDMYACIQAYVAAGVDCVLRSDHSPTLDGDVADVPGYSRDARLYAIGYTRGLIEAAVAERAR